MVTACCEVSIEPPNHQAIGLSPTHGGRGVAAPCCPLATGQWQEELGEKGGIVVPRPGTRHAGLARWTKPAPIRLGCGARDKTSDHKPPDRQDRKQHEHSLPVRGRASSWTEICRAARKQEEAEFNSATLLLNLLRQLVSRKARLPAAERHAHADIPLEP